MFGLDLGLLGTVSFEADDVGVDDCSATADVVGGITLPTWDEKSLD